MTPRWLFKLDTIPAPPPLFRYDHSDTRYYAELAADGENVLWYPSVTSIIRATSPMNPGLLQWYAKHGMDGATKLRDEAAERGTEMHIIIADYLMGETINVDGLPEFQRKAIASFHQFVMDHNVEPLAIEMLIHSKESLYAGTLDLVCRMDYKGRRILAIVDFKSGESFYRDHSVQLEFYRQAWNEHYGDEMRILNVFNWSPKDFRKAPTYNLKDQTGTVESLEVLLRSRLYRLTNDVVPKAKAKLVGSVRINTRDTVEQITVAPEDVVRQSWAAFIGDDK